MPCRDARDVGGDGDIGQARPVRRGARLARVSASRSGAAVKGGQDGSNSAAPRAEPACGITGTPCAPPRTSTAIRLADCQTRRPRGRWWPTRFTGVASGRLGGRSAQASATVTRMGRERGPTATPYRFRTGVGDCCAVRRPVCRLGIPKGRQCRYYSKVERLRRCAVSNRNQKLREQCERRIADQDGVNYAQARATYGGRWPTPSSTNSSRKVATAPTSRGARTTGSSSGGGPATVA